MRWSVLPFLLLVGVMACGSSNPPEPDPSAPSPSVSGPSPTATSIPDATLSRAGCPVTDDAFCDAATQIGRALLQRDAAALLLLSRSDAIECARVARQYFPGCADADVLTGHGLSGADFIVDILPRSAYAQRLNAVISGIDPAFTDELGGGSATVIGVGTCGPDIPRRPTYHLALTAAIDEGDGAERHLASFEVGFDGKDWNVILWYLDGLEAWEEAHPDPMALSFCEAGLHPWSV
jgi:hypothetical protein